VLIRFMQSDDLSDNPPNVGCINLNSALFGERICAYFYDDFLGFAKISHFLSAFSVQD